MRVLCKTAEEYQMACRAANEEKMFQLVLFAQLSTDTWSEIFFLALDV
jgi:hypothetical protein